MPSPQPPELSVPSVPIHESPIMPSLAAKSGPEPVATPLSWTPRQQSASTVSVNLTRATEEHSSPHIAPADAEMPHLIPSEFSLGTRRTTFSRLLDRVRFVRLDTRGKAISLALVAVVVIGGVLIAKSILITSPQEQQSKQALQDIRKEVDIAQTKNAEGATTEARSILTKAMTALETLGLTDEDSRTLSSQISASLDDVDNAQSVEPKLLASPGPESELIALATWASSSQTLRIGGTTSTGTSWVATLKDGTAQDRTEMGSTATDLLLGWRTSTLAVNTTTRTITRIVGGEVKSYLIPIQETVLDAAEFADNLYVLTDQSILKISDLETDKPVTKRWLNEDDQLSAGAARIFVDGSVYVLSRDGTFTTYYKGKKDAQVTVPVAPTGVWRLLPASEGLFAIAVGDARRIYLFDPEDGSLVRTLKIDSQLPFSSVGPGPGNSVLLLTSEGKLWQVQ